MTSGRTTVATPGTQQKLAAVSARGGELLVCPLEGNTEAVAIGDAAVRATSVGGVQRGLVLQPSTPPVRIHVDDISSVYADAQVAGEGVAWLLTGT